MYRMCYTKISVYVIFGVEYSPGRSSTFAWIILFGNPPCGWKPRISTSKCRNPGTIYEIGGVSLGAAAGHDSEVFKRAGGE